ncbi:hypothetical protein ABKN59_002827 [Abortiporus biennis]
MIFNCHCKHPTDCAKSSSLFDFAEDACTILIPHSSSPQCNVSRKSYILHLLSGLGLNKQTNLDGGFCVLRLLSPVKKLRTLANFNTSSRRQANVIVIAYNDWKTSNRTMDCEMVNKTLRKISHEIG